MSTLSTVVLLALAQAMTPSQRNAQSQAVLQVGVFSYGPDGKSQAAAYDTTLASESFQYIAGCVNWWRQPPRTGQRHRRVARLGQSGESEC